MAAFRHYDTRRETEYRVETSDTEEPTITQTTPEEEAAEPDAPKEELLRYDRFRQGLLSALAPIAEDTGLKRIDTDLQTDTATAEIIFQPDRCSRSIPLPTYPLWDLFSKYDLSDFTILPDFNREEITICIEINL